MYLNSELFSRWTRKSGLINYLEMIAGVDQYGVGRSIDVKPSSLMLNLQAADVVLYEKREKAVVGMR